MDRNQKKEQLKKADRRKFLKTAGIGSVVGGAAIVMGTPAQSAENSSERGTGYAETEHVQTYYKSTKF
jgi:gas vesicle protein